MSLRDGEYRVLVEQAPILIWRAGLDARCDYFNERWLAFTGRTMAQEMGNGWAEGVHPEDLDACLATYLDHFARRQPFAMRYRLRRHDGAWRWIDDRGTPTFVDGAFVGYVGSCVDVSEQVEAERALAERHAAELRQLHGLLPICASCKSIRDAAGTWHALESYIAARSRADFSHGICPPCSHRLYGV